MNQNYESHPEAKIPSANLFRLLERRTEPKGVGEALLIHGPDAGYGSHEYYQVVSGVLVCIRPTGRLTGLRVFLDNEFYTCVRTIKEGLKLAQVKIQAEHKIELLQRQLEDARREIADLNADLNKLDPWPDRHWER